MIDWYLLAVAACVALLAVADVTAVRILADRAVVTRCRLLTFIHILLAEVAESNMAVDMKDRSSQLSSFQCHR